MADIHILMVDDHPIIIEGYQNTLMATKKKDQTLFIDSANNCDTAFMLMEKAATERPYDICFFDISLPPSADGEITSGEDLAKLCNEMMPNAKVIILTMFSESFRIHGIIKEINPDGFLIKSDLTSMELSEAFQHVIENPPYYSNTVATYLKKAVTNDEYVDEINRKILYLLSKGIKTRSLTDHIDLSMSAIEKRKKQLKEIFNVKDGKDETLISSAKQKGLL